MARFWRWAARLGAPGLGLRCMPRIRENRRRSGYGILLRCCPAPLRSYTTGIGEAKATLSTLVVLAKNATEANNDSEADNSSCYEQEQQPRRTRRASNTSGTDEHKHLQSSDESTPSLEGQRA